MGLGVVAEYGRFGFRHLIHGIGGIAAAARAYDGGSVRAGMASELPPPPPLPAANTAAPFQPMPMPEGAWRYTAPAPVRHITPAWRIALVIGWLAVMAGVASFANSGFLVASSPFWIDWPLLSILPFVIPVAAVLALLRDWRHSLLASLAGALSLAVVAVIDIGAGSRPVGKGELALAAAGVLLTVAGMAGRIPRSAR